MPIPPSPSLAYLIPQIYDLRAWRVWEKIIFLLSIFCVGHLETARVIKKSPPSRLHQGISPLRICPNQRGLLRLRAIGNQSRDSRYKGKKHLKKGRDFGWDWIHTCIIWLMLVSIMYRMPFNRDVAQHIKILQNQRKNNSSLELSLR